MSTDKPLGELTQNPAEYFAIRNQPFNLGFKILYNTISAFIGGYICAIIGKSQPLFHSIALAVIQTLGFVYGMTLSEYAESSPSWLWITLTILTIGAILGAGFLRRQRRIEG